MKLIRLAHFFLILYTQEAAHAAGSIFLMTWQSGRIQPNPGRDHTAHPVRRGSFDPVFTASAA